MQRQYHIPDVPKEVYDALQKVHNAVKAVDISGNNSEFEKVDSILKALNTKELFEFSNLLHKRSFAFARIYLAANRDHTIQIDGATLVIGWGSLHIHVWYDGEYGKEEKNVEGDHAANASTLQSLGLELNSKELKYQILAATTPVQFYTHCVDFKMF